MAEQHPQEYWLCGLLAQGLTDAEVRAASDGYRYNAVPASYIKALRARMQKTRPPHQALESVAGRAWLKGQRVLAQVTEEPEYVLARDLLSNYTVRQAMEVLIISGASDREVANGIGTLRGKPLPERVARLYRHYFWNRDLLPMESWHAYSAAYQGEHGKKLKGCYARGIMFGLWKIGLRKNRIPGEAFDSMFQEAVMRFEELTTWGNGEKTAITAKTWLDSAIRVDEHARGRGDKLREAAEQVQLFTLRLGKRDITAVEQLEQAPMPYTAENNPESL